MKGSIVVLLATAMVAGAVGPQGPLQPASASGDARGHVDLNLADGSCISGAVEDVSLTLVLPYGTLMLPLSKVAGLERQEGGVLVSLRNGDQVHGRVEAPKALDVRTPYGTLSVPMSAIVQLRWTEPPSAPTAGPTAKPAAVRLVATLEGVQSVDAIKALPELPKRPREILICTQNVGAQCGGGTPATMWKLLLDPTTGVVLGLEKKQALDQVQQVRQTIFRDSSGTLFTGGGWCGFKPPYYSTDAGETWHPATLGTHPPNSTFCFAELNGVVYAGAGYEPNPGEVYRWRRDGGWDRLLSIGAPRSIVRSLAAHKGRLFVGTEVYWAGATGGGVPVYVSADGQSFKPTRGIPDNQSVMAFLPTGDDLYAFTRSHVFQWTGENWQAVTEYTFRDTPRPVASRQGVWYVAGQKGGQQGVFASADRGRTWNLIAALTSFQPWALEIDRDFLYVGTLGDKQARGYVYQIDLSRLGVPAMQVPTPQPKAFSGEGAGTPDDPYRIATPGQLQEMKLGLKAHYRLVKDIDASETAGWNDGLGFEPVGTESAGFSGSLDGAGHAITGLTIRRPEQDFVGLFGHVHHGRLTRVRVLGASVVGRNSVGILAGRDSDQFQYLLITKQCATSGTVQGRREVGGLFGHVYDAQIEDCFSSAQVTGEVRTGGLVGYMGFSQIRRCYASGTVNGREAAGGLTGGVDGHPAVWAKIENCFATGQIEATGPDVGGLNGFVTRDGKFIHWISSYYTDVRHDSPYGTYEPRVEAFQAKGDAAHPVFSSWDFSGVWRLAAVPLDFPVLACGGIASRPRN